MILVVLLTSAVFSMEQTTSFEYPWCCSAEEEEMAWVPLHISDDYNKNESPPGSPAEVAIAFVVSDVKEVNDEHRTITMQLEMPMSWSDSRIGVNTTAMHDVDKDEGYFLDLEWKHRIWFPAPIIRNMLQFSTLSSVKADEQLIVTKSEVHRFFYSASHTITFTCPLSFDAFPFDVHECFFEKAYFDKSDGELTLSTLLGDSPNQWGWANTTTVLGYTTRFEPLPEERLTRKLVGAWTAHKEHETQSVAGFKLMLRRKISVYVFNYYIPSGLFVTVSWVSLIIPPEAIPGRVALIITTFLVLVNIGNTVFSSSPIADTINPIQVWILACIVFVFLMVLEYIYILFLLRRAKTVSLTNTNLARKKANQPVTEQSQVDNTTRTAGPPTKGSGLARVHVLAGHSNGVIHEAAKSSFREKIKSRLKSRSFTMQPFFDGFQVLRRHLNNSLGPSLRQLSRRALKVMGLNEDEISLQIHIANMDHVFIWTVMVLFGLFNAAYWNWYGSKWRRT